MSESLQEYADSRGVRVGVDRRAAVIRGVKILGLVSRNGRRYLPDALAKAVALYEGAKVNVNHPKSGPLAPRDYQDRIGVLRDVGFRADDGLFGDFHFNPHHALAEQILWDADHAPENVGFSHNVLAHTKRDGDQIVVEAIAQVQSVDLVADPATTRGLFEMVQSGDASSAVTHAASADATADAVSPAPGDEALSQLTLEQFKHRRADLVAVIREEASAEIAALRDELDRIDAAQRAAAADRQRRASIRSLLAEYKLPDPDRVGPSAKAIVGDAFLDALLAAPDAAAAKALVEERARLVRAARSWDPASAIPLSTPTSRDQSLVESRSLRLNARSFVQAIT